MIKKRKILVTAAVILLVLVVASFCLTRWHYIGETREEFYENLDAAKKGDAMHGGWIPQVLPESAYDIYVAYDLDTNNVWARFRFDKRDINRLIRETKEVNRIELDKIEFASSRFKWWPQNLTRQFLERRQDVKLYRYDETFTYADNRQETISSFFIIDMESDTAYYWQY